MWLVRSRSWAIMRFGTDCRSPVIHLFSGKALTEEEQKMLDYILSSGTYGIMSYIVDRHIRERGRQGYFLSRMTPPV